jgi:hypothetical protein
VQLSKLAILLGITLVFGASAGSVVAQEQTALPASESKPVVAAETKAPADPQPATATSPKADAAAGKPLEGYKQSLNSLSTLYQN